jgi:hypothetical protein
LARSKSKEARAKREEKRNEDFDFIGALREKGFSH